MKKKRHSAENEIEHQSERQLFSDRLWRALFIHSPHTPASQKQCQEQSPQRLCRRWNRFRREQRRLNGRRVHERKVFAKSSARRSRASPPVNCVNSFSSVPALCCATNSSGFPSS